MEENKTVKEQLVEAREALAEEQEALSNFELSAKTDEEYVFRTAKEMAEETNIKVIYEKAEYIKRIKSDSKYYEKEIKKVNKKITALEKTIAKLEKMDVEFETDVIDEFLAYWRKETEEFIRKAVSTLLPEAFKELETSKEYKEAPWSKKEKMLSNVENQFGSAVSYCYGWRGDQMEQKMDDLLTRDVQMKKAVLLGRITEITGEVTEADLYVASDANLNGIVKGKKGNAKVQTILAGGYNIQVLHYRLLVHAF